MCLKFGHVFFDNEKEFANYISSRGILKYVFMGYSSRYIEYGWFIINRRSVYVKNYVPF